MMGEHSGDKSPGRLPAIQDLIVRHLDMFGCPKCRGPVRLDAETVVCENCGKTYSSDNGIPLLFYPHDPSEQERDVTDVVKAFYEKNPFPNYDDLDTAESLSQKANKGVFARLLEEQLPIGASIIECGCGTGQLTNFLGGRRDRVVFGTDLCLNSLRLAKGFRDHCNIRNAGFLQMNLFRPAFRDEVFDLVISNGVLHHTGDPLGGFKSIARMLKPNGTIIIGLYNTIGRLPTDIRRFLFRVSGDKLRFLDDHMRNKTYNEARKRAWFMDQYKHPHESKHSNTEVLGWFEENGFEFLSSIPKVDFSQFAADEKLFEPHDKGSKLTRFLSESAMMLAGDGGLFIMIGRKYPTRSAQQHPAVNVGYQPTGRPAAH